jgi:hypothetical protein
MREGRLKNYRLSLNWICLPWDLGDATFIGYVHANRNAMGD